MAQVNPADPCPGRAPMAAAMRRVIVTGARNWPDPDAVRAALDIQLSAGEFVLVHGECPTGADAHATQWWIDRGHPGKLERHPADWRHHGRAAGPIRNQQMVDAGADLVLAFPLASSRGTIDCVRRARRAAVPVHIVGFDPLDGA